MADGPVGVITGASGGLASAIARRLTADGWRLVLMSRSGAGEIARETGQIGLAGSVLETEDVEAAAACAVDEWGRLDGVLFSGGRQSDILKSFDMPAPPAPTDASFGYDPTYRREPFDIPFEAWTANYHMNVLGPMRLFRAALPHFHARHGGAFVAISGIEALQPRLSYPLGPNRLALHGFVRLLADRYGRDGIRANCIAPGMVENAAAEFPPGWVEQVPLGRYAHLTDIAAAAAFLLSDESGYVTGQTLVVDGGVNRTTGL
jgi:NAD(P)-dependent dehydrogenase (short-subunit alcohol dehydrogenase family)